jgi:hypothetical protein
MPDVDHVALLAIDDHVANEVDRPRGGARCGLVLPPLSLGAADDAEGADEVPDDVAYVLEAEGVRMVPEAGLVEVVEEIEPGAGVVLDVEELEAGEDVVQGGEVDEGVDGGGHAIALGALGVHHGARGGGAVEAHDEGDVAVIDAMGDLKGVDGIDLGEREANGGHDLLDAMGLVEVGSLAGLVPGLTVGVGVQVAEERGVVVDAGVGGVMEGGREAVGRGQGARVHDNIGEPGAVNACEEIGHGWTASRGRAIGRLYIV